jgi:thiamine biosynthesis lipoprotein
VQQIVDLDGEALATSGNYRIFFEQDGQRYSHIVNPRTGRPVAHDLASVSVIAPTTLEADALSTSLLVLGVEEGMNFAAKHDIQAFFIAGSDGEFEETASPAFSNRLQA